MRVNLTAQEIKLLNEACDEILVEHTPINGKHLLPSSEQKIMLANEIKRKLEILYFKIWNRQKPTVDYIR